jgi:hypothetical protein
MKMKRNRPKSKTADPWVAVYAQFNLKNRPENYKGQTGASINVCKEVPGTFTEASRALLQGYFEFCATVFKWSLEEQLKQLKEFHEGFANLLVILEESLKEEEAENGK